MKCPHCDKFIETPRTKSQNNALHKGCELLADALNSAGLDMRKLLKETYNLPWNTDTVKKHLFKPFMKSITGKESTTELKKADGEIKTIWNTLLRELGEKHGIEYIRFPSKYKCCDSVECICGKYED